MIYKASFLLVPCFYNSETHEVTARYGKINEWFIDRAVSFWLFIAETFPDCGSFPIDLYREDDQ